MGLLLLELCGLEEGWVVEAREGGECDGGGAREAAIFAGGLEVGGGRWLFAACLLVVSMASVESLE